MNLSSLCVCVCVCVCLTPFCVAAATAAVAAVCMYLLILSILFVWLFRTHVYFGCVCCVRESEGRRRPIRAKEGHWWSLMAGAGQRRARAGRSAPTNRIRRATANVPDWKACARVINDVNTVVLLDTGTRRCYIPSAMSSRMGWLAGPIRCVCGWQMEWGACRLVNRVHVWTHRTIHSVRSYTKYSRPILMTIHVDYVLRLHAIWWHRWKIAVLISGGKYCNVVRMYGTRDHSNWCYICGFCRPCCIVGVHTLIQSCNGHTNEHMNFIRRSRSQIESDKIEILSDGWRWTNEWNVMNGNLIDSDNEVGRKTGRQIASDGTVDTHKLELW